MAGTGTPAAVKAPPAAVSDIDEMRAVFAHAAVGIALLDKGGRVLRSNPHLELMLDGEKLDNTGMEFAELLHPEDRPRIQTMIADLLGDQRAQLTTEARFVSRTGRNPWGQISLTIATGEEGAEPRLVAAVVDVTERHMTDERLSHMASHDALTGLPNRMLFTERLERALMRARRNKLTTAVMFIDLDHFKQINDSLGHHAGDLLLQQVAERLNRTVRKGDTVARLAGDEFTLLLEEVTDFRDATIVARKILAQFAEPFDLEGQVARNSPSIGISLYPLDGDDSQAVMQQADKAMYIAKKEGRGSFRFASADLSERAFQRHAMEEALRSALSSGEGLELYYQPLVDLASSQVVGAEALMRWHHPELGLMTPGQFLAIANDGKLGEPLAEWVLDESLKQVAAWVAAGHTSLRLAINVGRSELYSEAYFKALDAAIASHGVLPDNLAFEVPEGMATEASPQTQKAITRLYEMGCHITFDDFGAGKTDFRLLRRGSFDAIKIAPDFIRAAAENVTEAKLVRAAIVAAHSRGITVMAKSVETNQQLAFLKRSRCDCAQGFLFSRAVPAAEFLPLAGGTLTPNP